MITDDRLLNCPRSCFHIQRAFYRHSRTLYITLDELFGHHNTSKLLFLTRVLRSDASTFFNLTGYFLFVNVATSDYSALVYSCLDQMKLCLPTVNEETTLPRKHSVLF